MSPEPIWYFNASDDADADAWSERAFKGFQINGFLKHS